MSDGDFGFGFIMGVVCVVFVGLFLSANSSPSMYSFDCYDDSGNVTWSESVHSYDYTIDGDYAYVGKSTDKHICRTHWTVEKECNEKEDRCR